MKERNKQEVNQTAAPAKQGKKFKLPLSAYLSYLLVACLLVMGVTFSGYVSSAGGSDSARVAKFEITEQMFQTKDGDVLKDEEVMSTPISATLAPGETVERYITVKNSSEVSIAYAVDLVQETNNLPELAAVLDLVNATGTVDYRTEKDDYLMVSGAEAEFRMAITWPAEENSSEYMGQVDTLLVKITATQVD